LFLKTKGYDFIVFPNFVSVPSIRKIPYCVAVHDMSFEDCPEYLSKGNRTYLQRFTTKSVIGANFVISISEFTKSRIKKHYGKATADKTLVIPIPYEYVKPKGDISKSIKDLASKPFLLHVGTIEPRKNISNLVKGFASTKPNIRDNYRLVLAGGRGWNDEDIINTLENTKGLADVAPTGYVSDAERDYLYSKSAAVCMLSHYEGFGMPILEAFHYNKPLLLSSIDVFHEVASTQAIYCNQNDIKDISASITRILDKGKPTHKTDGKSWRDNANSVLIMMREGISK
jgi:glycosyltransferase involved in cell wall biosynthesis